MDFNRVLKNPKLFYRLLDKFFYARHLGWGIYKKDNCGMETPGNRGNCLWQMIITSKFE